MGLTRKLLLLLSIQIAAIAALNTYKARTSAHDIPVGCVALFNAPSRSAAGGASRRRDAPYGPFKLPRIDGNEDKVLVAPYITG
jgi:hypothetical protein